MSLLGNNTLPQPPQEPDKEQLLKQTVRRIKNMSRETFNQLVRVQREGIRLGWENEHLSAQEILDELGSDAIKVLQFHGGLTQFIQSIADADGAIVELKQPTNAFTVNLSAGTVTVLDEPYQV